MSDSNWWRHKLSRIEYLIPTRNILVLFVLKFDSEIKLLAVFNAIYW